MRGAVVALCGLAACAKHGDTDTNPLVAVLADADAAWAHRGDDDFAAATEALGRAWQQDPREPEVLWRFARLHVAKGLSLADLTELTGMDRSALSKLETGQRTNPTVETLVRYADAVGKRLVVSLADA